MKQTKKITRYTVGFAAIAQLLLFPVASFAETPTISAPASEQTQASSSEQTTGTPTPSASAMPSGTNSEDTFVEVNTDIQSHAQSGAATVSNNTSGGNAISGSALVMANILNMVQSSWGIQGGDVSTFSTDINGDIVGDMVLDPNQVNASELPLGSTNTIDLGINIHNSGTINNNIELVASSGDASVSGNTQAGNAVSGTAAAMVNIMNIISSTISAGQSFVGNINIHGNFEGDILLPKEMRDQLVRDTPPTTTLNPTEFENPDALNSVTTQTITNNISLQASSGNANVSDNTEAGNALSGNANTNLMLYNLTGKQIIGSNALLVFVNVLGEWVGMIVNAPAGATSSMIGNNTTTNTIPVTAAGSVQGDNTINNNITVSASSGDATVSGNTGAGSALSGDAKASASILNMAGSQLSLADWFGVLFINVLGTWHGSFGIDTIMGGQASGSNTDAEPTSPQVSGIQVFEVTPGENNKLRLTPSKINTATSPHLPASHNADASSTTNVQEEKPQVLAATTGKPNTPHTISKTDSGVNLWVVALCIGIALSLFAVERTINFYSTRKTRI